MNRLRGRYRSMRSLRRVRLLGDLVAYLGTIALLPALMLGGITDVWNAVWDKTIGVAENVVNYVKSAIETFWNWLWENAILPVYQAIRGAVGAVVSTLNQFMIDVGKTFWDTWGKITTAVSGAIGWASDSILYWYHQAEGLINSAAGWLGGQVNALWGYARGLADTIYHTFVEPIWHALENLPGWINDNLVQPAIHALGDVAGMAWRAVEPILRPYISWIEAIKGTIAEAWTLARRLWDALWPIVSDPLGWITNRLSWLLQHNGGNVVDRMTQAIGDNADAMESILVRWFG